MIIDLNKGWKVLQDVHDTGEKLGLYREGFSGDMGNQISEWEELPELKHLQLLLARQPYFGRELRYFNQAPWWYKLEFELPEEGGTYAKLHFTNVDYYCKIWLNGEYVGEHEGYSMPFSFRVDDKIRSGETNTLIVKVWSPWDTEILDDRCDRRTFLVCRNSIKGTYEHSDTFVQRDVNPVGIYGEVTIELCGTACFADVPEIDYTLSDDLKDACVRVKVNAVNVDHAIYTLRFVCRDWITGETLCETSERMEDSGEYILQADAMDIRLWNTWDKGGPWLYNMVVELLRDNAVVAHHEELLGFRKIELFRDADTTRFYLNDRSFYVRGTSYFPDLYISNMCEERYRRDLLNIRAAGFNLVRIHVHVELPIFYELCSQIGIGIMQDSEYNWMHPADDAFARRFIDVYLDTVRMLKRYSSMFCWICMNEPGLEDPMGKDSGRAMTVNPGPALYRAVQELDPSRPAIKGSYCEDDLSSGDSHNYLGSLNGHETHYVDIFGTREKLNTEYGFDAPPCVFSLKKCPPVMKRLLRIADRFDEIQEYQYKLLKYYTEHYRTQKYAPNSGYVQFLFNDLCPQSFYGLYDWWGLPKKGLEAMLESNMPVGIFLKYNRDHIDGVYVVNDDLTELGEVQVRIVLTDDVGYTIWEQNYEAYVEADGVVQVCNIGIKAEDHAHINCALLLMKEGKVIASNRYANLFVMPEHVQGHPHRIDHELGVRLYFA